MRRPLILAACLAVTACVTPGGLSLAQGLYGAYGGYEAAAGTFADYAETPGANKAVVHAVRVAVTSDEAKAAVAFGRAFKACHGSNTVTVAGINCASFAFTPAGINAAAIELRSLIVTLGQR